MRILIVSLWPISSASVGGTERYVIDLATGLKKKDVDASVLMLSGNNNKINGVEFQSIDLTGIGEKLDEYSIKEHFFKSFTQLSLVKFAKYINDRVSFAGYDCVHFNSLLFWYVKLPQKCIFTIHENNFEFSKNWGSGAYSVMAKIIKNSESDELFIAPSKHYAKCFSADFDRTIIVRPHAFNTMRINSKYVEAKNKNESIYTLLIPSRLDVRQKGQDVALEALRFLKKRGVVLKVVMSGCDSQYHNNRVRLENMSRVFKIEVLFDNFVDIFDAYRHADIILLPSRSESFGYSALESLYFGKKVVLSNIPPFREIAEGNPNAYISAINPYALSVVIEKVLNKSVKKVPEVWKNRYNYDTWTDSHIKLLRDYL